MKNSPRLKIALQKKGRLNHDSVDLLKRCGLTLQIKDNALLCHCENMPIDVLFVRDDDIPALVSEAICDVGIIGDNTLSEQMLDKPLFENTIIRQCPLSFGSCRLSLAVPQDFAYATLYSLKGKRIATTYPKLLASYLERLELNATIVTVSGSVEIAPKLTIADAICDLVSTGTTLSENNLREVETIFKSEAQLIRSANLNDEKKSLLDLLTKRIEGVLKAQGSKYIMFHAPRAAVDAIKQFLPGCESPTILPLDGEAEKVAVHLVSHEKVFWTTLEQLKQAGASSILVLPIEKMMV